jgi:hypothetical protein
MKKVKKDLEGEIYRRMDDLLTKNADLIRAKSQRSPRTLPATRSGMS